MKWNTLLGGCKNKRRQNQAHHCCSHLKFLLNKWRDDRIEYFQGSPFYFVIDFGQNTRIFRWWTTIWDWFLWPYFLLILNIVFVIGIGHSLERDTLIQQRGFLLWFLFSLKSHQSHNESTSAIINTQSTKARAQRPSKCSSCHRWAKRWSNTKLSRYRKTGEWWFTFFWLRGSDWVGKISPKKG